MTPLLWMLSWLPVVLPAVGELPTPINVTLTSLNFTYILKWEAGPGTPDGVHYEVTYLPDSRGYSWDPVSGCERVQKPLVCNLTAVFSSLIETYFTMVTAHLGERVSPAGRSQYDQHGFKPISHLSLPLLSVTPSSRDLSVELQPPVERFRDTYENFSYDLQLRSGKNKPRNIKIESLMYRWENLVPGKQYCVAVRFNENVYSHFSQPKCAVIPKSFSADPLILGVLCLMVIVIVAIVIYLISAGYMCLRWRPLPRVLTTIHSLDQEQVHDYCVISSLLSVEPPAPSADKKRSSHSSSDESDEDGETESTGVSTGGAYTERGAADPLSSSSSCLSQPKPPPDLSSNQLPYSQRDVQISTGSPSRAGLELRTDCGGRAKEEEEEAQDVNLLTLTFGRVEQEEEQEEEEEEKSDLGVQQVEFDAVLPTEDTTEAVHEDEEEECGYMGRPRV